MPGGENFLTNSLINFWSWEWLPRPLKAKNFLWARLLLYSVLFFFMTTYALTAHHDSRWFPPIVAFSGTFGALLFSAATIYWRVLPDRGASRRNPERGALEDNFDEHLDSWMKAFACCQEPMILAMSFGFYTTVFLALVVSVTTQNFATGLGTGVTIGTIAFVCDFFLAQQFIRRAERELNARDAEYERSAQFNETVRTFLTGKAREKEQLRQALVEPNESHDAD